MLSGDVALPTGPQAGGDVVLIDDVNTALTWVNPQTCAIRHQISVGDFKSFPHDVVSLNEGKAYVTRFGTNSTPTDDPMSRGEDLLILDLKSMPIRPSPAGSTWRRSRRRSPARRSRPAPTRG